MKQKEAERMPRAREALRPVNLRLPRAMLSRAEALCELLSDTPAPELAILPNVTRSDVLRLCLLRGLEAIEREYEAAVDEGLIEATEEAMAQGGKPIPWEQVKERLGL